MKHKFIAKFTVGGTPEQSMEMEYDDKDIIATLERRLKTAFPNARGIVIKRADDDSLNQLELKGSKAR